MNSDPSGELAIRRALDGVQAAIFGMVDQQAVVSWLERFLAVTTDSGLEQITSVSLSLETTSEQVMRQKALRRRL